MPEVERKYRIELIHVGIHVDLKIPARFYRKKLIILHDYKIAFYFSHLFTFFDNKISFFFNKLYF